MTAVPTTNRTAAPYRPGADTSLFRLSAVRTLVARGPVVHLYGRQHIDLQRVAGALCSR
ncbi:putative leader peptide [Actinacidiphila acididurans]|uniref:putative leader peptide n=1 Tax=Actinacidiphila acididurans TaxID=2784346 RepID=UPI0035572294